MAKRQELELQVAQLESQVNELKSQIGSLHAQIGSLQAQNQELGSQLQQQNAQLESYRSREQAVVYALTEAKEVNARRVTETEAKARQILQDAESKKYAVQRQSEAIEREANAKAQVIVENAKREAEKTLADMQIAARDVEAQLGRLNAALRETAQRAQQQAGEFAYSINSLRTDAQDAPAPVPAAQASFDISMLADGPEDAFSVPQQQASQISFTDAPMDDPKKVMQDIYQLQGREIPAPAAPAPQEHVFAPAPAPEQAAMPPVAPAGADLDSLLSELLGGASASPIPQAPQAQSAPQPAPVPAPEAYSYTPPPPPVAAQPGQGEERLWTVDEIMGGVEADAAATMPPAPEQQAYQPQAYQGVPAQEQQAYQPQPYQGAPAPEQQAYQPQPYQGVPAQEQQAYQPQPYQDAPAPEQQAYQPQPYQGVPAQEPAGLDSLLDDIIGGQPAQSYAPAPPPQGSPDLDSLLDDILGS